ncbi:hypothetical protein PYCCODRAFT_1306608 [Trametes coccinea BRFM310]|uniref:F-box domain-containing protein n=1 Tax=Trametes coccinea (strain BRFM310) TaxID=1353009 RepID=A0A1Y2I805_TRAC3|nr:hypothetical protein PYCCODRAFT_1306608 [Trametes coccinea BRFM310]
MNDHARLCNLYDPLFLNHALRNMPLLTTVELGLKKPVHDLWWDASPHGIPWSTVESVLSVPQLQRFALRFYRLAPWLSPGEQIQLQAPSPGLTALEYCLNRRDSRFDSEDQALALILRTFRTTLRKLDLPIELALIEPLRSLEWPALQELRFHGEPNTDDARFSLSDNMPLLHTLDLALSVSSGYTPTPLWLPTTSRPGDFPCQDLQQLVIAFPCVTDALWACLPPTLHELSLVCYPHTNLGTDLESLSDLDWGQTIPRASGLLKVLRMCDLPTLRVLGVAYIEDDDERHLLRLIGTRFSTLEELVIVRYAHERRGSNQAIASAEDPTEALVCPPGLRIVSLHMDLPDCPRPSRRRVRGRRRSEYCPYEIENFKEQTLDVAADRLARTLPASATTVRFLLPRYDGMDWLEYGIVRSDQERRAVRLP